jgi:NAD(P)-dependent dehydrogenase (short-subunit alcohol dehydrogenase family)
MNDFADRVVVITGGTGALGIAVVKTLLERGAVCHVPVFAAKELDHFPFRNHERVQVRAGLDMTVEATAKRYYGELPSLWASIHLAGGFVAKPIAETALDDFLSLMNTNAVTCFLACREAVVKMRASGRGGRIVNVAAKPALVPTAGVAAYAASKAVASLTVSLSEELASEGIFANAVAPSIMDTPRNRADMPNADHARWPKVEEVASVIAFLASPENAVGRGAIVPVFGRT